MNIHEYQAKRLLHEYGAPIANGVAVYSVEQAEEWAKKLPLSRIHRFSGTGLSAHNRKGKMNEYP